MTSPPPTPPPSLPTQRFRSINRNPETSGKKRRRPHRLPVLAVDLSDQSFFATAVAVLVRSPPRTSAADGHQSISRKKPKPKLEKPRTELAHLRGTRTRPTRSRRRQAGGRRQGAPPRPSRLPPTPPWPPSRAAHVLLPLVEQRTKKRAEVAGEGEWEGG